MALLVCMHVIQDRDTLIIDNIPYLGKVYIIYALIEQSINTLIEQSSNIYSCIGTFSLAAKDILQIKYM